MVDCVLNYFFLFPSKKQAWSRSFIGYTLGFVWCKQMRYNIKLTKEVLDSGFFFISDIQASYLPISTLYARLS